VRDLQRGSSQREEAVKERKRSKSKRARKKKERERERKRERVREHVCAREK